MELWVKDFKKSTGRALIKNFAKNWQVANIDFTPNNESHLNLLLDPKDTPNQHIENIKS